jgi:hypothetical protein
MTELLDEVGGAGAAQAAQAAQGDPGPATRALGRMRREGPSDS